LRGKCKQLKKRVLRLKDTRLFSKYQCFFAKRALLVAKISLNHLLISKKEVSLLIGKS